MRSQKSKQLEVVVIQNRAIQQINQISLIILVVRAIRVIVEREVTEIIKVVVVIIGLKTTAIISKINEKTILKVEGLTEVMSKGSLNVTFLAILITQL